MQFNPATYSENEGDQVVFMLELSSAADRAVTVDFTTVDGSATGCYVIMFLELKKLALTFSSYSWYW